MTEELIYEGLCTSPRFCLFPNSPEYHQCFRCRRRDTLDHHHIVERSQGGKTEQTNMATLCRRCHDDIHMARLLASVEDGMFVIADAKTGAVVAQTRLTGDWNTDPEHRFLPYRASGAAEWGVITEQVQELSKKAIAARKDTLPAVRSSDYAIAGVPGSLSPVAWVCDETLPYDRWASWLRNLASMEWGRQFWIGDCINWGETAYGEKYAQAVSETGLDEQTLMNYASIARRVPAHVRRVELSWSHHATVTRFPEAEQVEWLKAAAELGWGVTEFRLAVKGLVEHDPTEPVECAHDSKERVYRCTDCLAVVEGT